MQEGLSCAATHPYEEGVVHSHTRRDDAELGCKHWGELVRHRMVEPLEEPWDLMYWHVSRGDGMVPRRCPSTALRRMILRKLDGR